MACLERDAFQSFSNFSKLGCSGVPFSFMRSLSQKRECPAQPTPEDVKDDDDHQEKIAWQDQRPVVAEGLLRFPFLDGGEFLRELLELFDAAWIVGDAVLPFVGDGVSVQSGAHNTAEYGRSGVAVAAACDDGFHRVAEVRTSIPD